ARVVDGPVSSGRTVTRVVDAWRRWWFTPAPLVDLAVARLIVVGILVLLDWNGRGFQVASVAPAFFRPVPLLVRLGLTSQPSLDLLQRLATLEWVLLVFVAVGLLARPALLGVFVVQVLREAWGNSLG